MIASNTYPFAGSVVIVTGAGSGIGRSIARAFLEQGASVVVTGRRVQALAETIEGWPTERALAIAADGADPESAARVVRDTVEKFGRLDVVVNNAGRHVGGRIDDLDPADWNGLFATNVTALFTLVQAALPELEKTRGNIVAISSVSGMRGDWGQAGYNASKGAVNVFVQSLALDLGERGIRVNVVAPAFTLTEMTADMAGDEEAIAPFVDRVALGRPGLPDDVAPAVLFLASADAGYITGAILPVDGGTSASTGQPHV